MNTLDEKLKFTMEYGGESICFLDLKISIMGNQLFTTVYSKPTDSHLYLQADSCHRKISINGIQKGVALRLRIICSTDEEYQEKAKLYMAYLVARQHDPVIVKKTFDDTSMLSKNEARRKKNAESKKKVFFATKYNPRGPNINAIVGKYMPLISNCPALKNVFCKNSVVVAHKREKNLKDLLVRGDPYAIKSDLLDKDSNGYKRCKNKCDSCDNFVQETDHITCRATGKIYKIRRNITCSTPNIIYCAYCLKCKWQGVGSTIRWKPRLSNYKSHINKKVNSCEIVKHFIDVCKDEQTPTSNIRFILHDSLNNTDNLSSEEIDNLLLKKEQFWIGTLLTQHQGLNNTHDWNRKTRWEKPK